MEEIELPRAKQWATTMQGHGQAQITAHRDTTAKISGEHPHGRLAREAAEAAFLRPEATKASGAGNRVRPEQPDPERTCFQRDRDRIVHSTAFRRLAGKTQVVVYPTDHQRTRLTHALEVAQCATSIARGLSVNVDLTEAIALGHDCGHGPGGHASEDAFDAFLPQGYDHGPWGADVVLTDLNLCAETLDGIRNHSWSRPAPHTIEGEIVSWADRIAYCAHDLEDAIHAGIVSTDQIPQSIREIAGVTRRDQLRTFITAVIRSSLDHGRLGMDSATATALAELRQFNYDHIYTRADSVAQSVTVVRVLRGLVEYYLSHPGKLPNQFRMQDPVMAAVAYVGGMTDRFAFEQAAHLLGWNPTALPRGIGRGA